MLTDIFAACYSQVNLTCAQHPNQEAPQTPPKRPRRPQDGPKTAPNASKRAQNLWQSRGSWQASYVWESFWGDLEMSLNHFYPIVKSLGPSSAYLGPLLQPTCSSTSFLGTLMPQLTAPKLCLASFADFSDIEADTLTKNRCRLRLFLKLQHPSLEALGPPTLNPWKPDSNQNVSARTCTRHDKFRIQT